MSAPGPMRPARRADIPPFYVMQVMKAAREREAATGDVLHLEVGQPSSGAPALVRRAAIEAIEGDRLRYTDADGTPALKARIAGWYGDRHDLDVDPARIVVTTGASGACVLAFLACFDVGDRVAVARPSYPCYRNMLSSFGVEVVDVPVGAGTRYQPTVEALRATQATGPLAGLVVASPSNPTGTMVPAAELAAIAATARDAGVRLIVDEIYHGITYGDAATSVLVHDPDVVVVNSFSKYFSMTGWRLGWLVLPPDLVAPVERLAQNLTVAPPTLAQLAAVAAFEPESLAELDAHVERYRRNRDVVLAGLAHAGIGGLTPPDGAFYLWCPIGGLIDRGVTASAEQLCSTWLADLGVAVTPGIDFDPVDGQRFVRFSFAGDEAEVREAMRRIGAWEGWSQAAAPVT